MFCSNCSAAVPDGASVCPSCNAAIASAGPSTGPHASAARAVSLEYAQVVKTSSVQALGALKSLAGNPVGALPATYETLTDAGAMRVGIAFGVVSVLCFLLGGFLMLPSFIRSDFFKMIGFFGFLKCIVFALMPFICAAGCSLAVRKAVGSAGGLGADCFVAGTALLPMSIWALISGMAGYANMDFIAIVTVFAFCFSILILFAGYTRVYKLSERLGTYAVPVVVIVSVWLVSVVGRSIVTNSVSDSIEDSPRVHFSPGNFPGQ